MALSNYLFEIPSKFEAALKAGELVRFGGILKDSGTGKIVAHLQETGITPSTLFSLVKGPLAAIDTISNLAANVQLAQIKSILNTMELLQISTLGASAAGMGISAVGFVLINDKLNKINSKLDEIKQEIITGFNEVRQSRIRDMLSELNGLRAIAEHKYSLRETGNEWNSIGEKFIEKSERFRGEIEHLFSEKEIHEPLFDTLLEACLICNSTAMKSFFMADKIKAANKHAENVYAQYNRLFDNVSPLTLSEKLTNTARPGISQNTSLQYATQKTAFLRDIQDTAGTTPILMETLLHKKISGPEYIASIQDENLSPIVLVKVPE